MAYKDYLASDHWKQLKKKKERASIKRCSICGSLKNIHCHHLFYKSLYDVGISDLRWLCSRCHNLAHECLSAGMINPAKKNRNNPQIVYRITRRIVRKKLGLPVEDSEPWKKPTKKKKQTGANSHLDTVTALC